MEIVQNRLNFADHSTRTAPLKTKKICVNNGYSYKSAHYISMRLKWFPLVYKFGMYFTNIYIMKGNYH